MKTVADILLQGAARHAGREAVADPGETLTYEELALEAGRLARAQRGLGLRGGDRSLVVLPNSANFLRAHFANLFAGAVSVPCEPALTRDTFDGIAASCAPRFLISDPATVRRLEEAGPLPPSIEHVIVLGTGGEWSDPRIRRARDLVDPADRRPFAVNGDPSALAALMYTTGTTGKPKGVMMTNDGILAALRGIVSFVGYTPADREVVVLPLSHNFGLGHAYCNLLSGGAIYTENGLGRVGRVLNAIESFGATGFPSTPMGIGILLDQYGPVFARKARNLRFSVINSAPLPPERTAQLQAMFPNLDIMVYYGLTEASRTAFASLTRLGPAYYRSVGRATSHSVVEVRGADGSPLGPDEPGEVVVRGPALAAGYWNNPEETAVVFRDGWLHTGDLGRLDPNGYLWISGRLKDVINVGGYKVLPSEVEKVLAGLDGIADVGVVGVDGLAGFTTETVVAAIVTRPGAAIDETVLQQQCLRHLERFKTPARFVAVNEIPRTNTGKIKRQDLAKAVAARLRADR